LGVIIEYSSGWWTCQGIRRIVGRILLEDMNQLSAAKTQSGNPCGLEWRYAVIPMAK